ncbi:3D domain-containing protein [Megalodesulfovibrio paquesii]
MRTLLLCKAILILGVICYFQYRLNQELETQLEGYRASYNQLQLAQASTEGALEGLQLSSYTQQLKLINSLADNKSKVTELLRMVQQKDFLIQSMTRGRVCTVTAYSPTVGQTDDTPFTTANNKRVRDGIVAVSRDLFANGWNFGRKIYIKDHGVYTIDDLMNERMRNSLDIFMFDTETALKFGKRQIRAYLLGA